ncbi:metalloprotease TldD [Clostridium tepidiprofundi DSM 19306]|uniref:Metalloprotease TldD n=1 Tax=Clostridium tepidiprofundi DSM 19306 TaxID=1121338 RepID=A0A151B2T4_9CLOT|nr:TldD/PmbA family protein [Clostridium tepidiprofundi]KYH33977.1 metalloprotease TldD [Clostridium tepidiprofundi DSM 19306]
MKNLLNKVISIGATDGEIYYKNSTKRNIAFANNNLKEVSFTQSTGVALRMIKDGKLSFSTSTDLNEFDNLVKSCDEITPFSSPAEFNFINKHSNEDISIPENNIMDLNDEQLIEDGKKIITDITKEFPDVKVGVEFDLNSSYVEICNSKGLLNSYKKDSLSFSVSSSFIKDNNFINFYDIQLLLNSNYDINAMTNSVLEQIRLCRNIVTLDSGPRPVIFTPNFLCCSLIPLMLGVNGKKVEEGSSPLAKKLGTQIFDERFTIVDDATRPGAFNTHPFDDEGTPSQRTEIIKNGRLQSFLHSLKTAKKLNMEPTGNGYKLGNFLPKHDISAEPSPYVTNLHVEPGKVSLHDMIADLKDGVIIDSVIGFFMGNIGNGEITGSIDMGYHVKNGKIVGKISGQSINFNIYDIFKNNLIDISSTTKNTPFFFFHGYNPIPYAMFKDINIE